MKAPSQPSWHLADTLVAAAVLLAVLAVFWQITYNLEYDWEWSRTVSYIASYGEDGLRSGLIADGFITMVRLLVLAGIGAALLGVALGIAGNSRIAGLRLLSAGYVEFVRNQPLLVFLFVFYYFISDRIVPQGDLGLGDGFVAQVLFGDTSRASALVSGALCLMFYEAAFVAEIVRGGIQSVDSGVVEGGRALGLRKLQILRLIVLPIALRRTVPPLVSQTVLLVKNSSVISVISVQELTFAALETANSIDTFFEPLLLAAFLYFIICWPLTVIAGRMELPAGQPGLAR
ncbi:MAG: amino acid ABC transporter permease [Betaproteobacteria bacterium]|nr:amino acid ABC transporter permease [Betaproteobacteria bacterium]